MIDAALLTTATLLLVNEIPVVLRGELYAVSALSGAAGAFQSRGRTHETRLTNSVSEGADHRYGATCSSFVERERARERPRAR